MGPSQSQKQDFMPVRKAEPIDFLDFTELVSFCPRCKNIETFLFCQCELVSQHNYKQHDESVFHDYGSDIPRHLYGTSVSEQLEMMIGKHSPPLSKTGEMKPMRIKIKAGLTI